MKRNEKKVFEVKFDNTVQGKGHWWFVAFTLKQVKHWMKKREAVFAAKDRPLPRFNIEGIEVDPGMAIAEGSVDYDITH